MMRAVLVIATHPSALLQDFDLLSAIIHRKVDSDLKTIPQGFELLMSHTFHKNSSAVIGFYKATENTNIATNIMHIRRSVKETAHPMLLPIILLSSNIGPNQETYQKQTRAKLHTVEDALLAHLASNSPSTISIERINVELMKCHSSVWKSPGAAHKVIDGMESILGAIRVKQYRIEQSNHLQSTGATFLDKVNDEYAQRVDFIRERLRGLESYCHTTLSKIDVQRTALHNLLLY